jgi:UDP-2,4-diacetamido-2,4,6-trideoxy-beta-L-altropyranose hydrolase
VLRSNKCVVFRADGSPHIGLGHVRRCLTLGTALSARGWEIGLACREETGRFVQTLRAAGVKTVVVPDEPAREIDAMRMAWPQGTNWLVVDHYGLGADYESAAAGWARKVAAIDDWPARRHTVDLLLDPNLGRRASEYEGLLDKRTTVLAGADYILLRPDIAAQPRRQGGEPQRARRVLVAFGGSDPDNLTEFALDAIDDPRLDDIAVTVIVGPANVRAAGLRARAIGRIEVQVDPPDLPARMAAAELAIAGSGSMAWELAYLGVPMLLVVNSPGTVVKSLVQAEAARALGSARDVTRASMIEALLALIPDCVGRARMAAAGRNAVDGCGAARVADFLDASWQ